MVAESRAWQSQAAKCCIVGGQRVPGQVGSGLDAPGKPRYRRRLPPAAASPPPCACPALHTSHGDPKQVAARSRIGVAAHMSTACPPPLPARNRRRAASGHAGAPRPCGLHEVAPPAGEGGVGRRHDLQKCLLWRAPAPSPSRTLGLPPSPPEGNPTHPQARMQSPGRARVPIIKSLLRSHSPEAAQLAHCSSRSMQPAAWWWMVRSGSAYRCWHAWGCRNCKALTALATAGPAGSRMSAHVSSPKA